MKFFYYLLFVAVISSLYFIETIESAIGQSFVGLSPIVHNPITKSIFGGQTLHGKFVKADKIGKSENLVVNASFVWVIDNFEYWVFPGFHLRSPKFTVPFGEKKLDFTVTLEEGKDLALLLSVNFENTSDVNKIYAKTKVSLLGHDGIVIAAKEDFWSKRGVRSLYVNESVKWPNFVLMEDLFKSLGKQKDLPVMVEFQLPNPTDRSASEITAAKAYMKSKIAQCKGFAEIGSQLFNDTRYCDLEFEFDKYPNEVLPAHRAILNIRAPKILDSIGPLKVKQTPNGPRNVATIKDLAPGDFKEILNYIYTDTEPKELREKPLKYFELAKKFGLPDLKGICEHELYRTLTITNALNLLKFAGNQNLPKLKGQIYEYVRENANLISPTNWDIFLTKLTESIKCDEVGHDVGAKTAGVKATGKKTGVNDVDVELIEPGQKSSPGLPKTYSQVVQSSKGAPPKV